MPLSYAFYYGFLKVNSNNHPTVTTLRPGADGIGTVMQAFESRPTRAASGRLRAASGRCPDGSGRRPDGYRRLLVGPGKTAGIREVSPVGVKIEELWVKGFVEEMSFERGVEERRNNGW